MQQQHPTISRGCSVLCNLEVYNVVGIALPQGYETIETLFEAIIVGLIPIYKLCDSTVTFSFYLFFSSPSSFFFGLKVQFQTQSTPF
jgi:hypothetical protein